MKNPAILVAAVALTLLVYLGNPAIALFTGAILTISLNRELPQGAAIGGYALQTAIVFLGFIFF